MREQWEECWRFETANLAVVFEVTPCEDDPADSLDDEAVADIMGGCVEWFDARVRVLLVPEGQELGADYLGCCAYNTVREFYESHRMHRRGDYFTDMVSEAIRAARKSLEHVAGVPLRAT